MRHIRYTRGSVLLEAVVALAAIMVTVAAILTVVTISVSNSSFVKNQNLANKYAQQAMEYMRGIKETDFDKLNLEYPSACLDTENTETPFSVGTDCYIQGTAFKRIITLSSSGGGVCESGNTMVAVTVKWQSSKCTSSDTFCHNVRLVSCFAPPAGSDL